MSPYSRTSTVNRPSALRRETTLAVGVEDVGEPQAVMRSRCQVEGGQVRRAQELRVHGQGPDGAPIAVVSEVFQPWRE